MPELPEVEVVRRGLADHVVGRQIVAAEFSGSRVARRHEPGPADLAQRLAGLWVRAARRRGKYLWLELAQGNSPGERAAYGLIVHLGMSGQLLVKDSAAPAQKHRHARVVFGDGDPELWFVDQRTFGGFAFDDLDEAGVPRSLGHIALDPFEPEFDQTSVVRRIKLSDSAIKRLLLNQSVVSGVGNIYADESLWRAQVHGSTPGSALSKPAIGRVLDAAAEVMSAALAQGGTSFDALYVNVNGASGYFDRSLEAYGQEGESCSRCGTVIVRAAFMNRSSYFCPRCQRRR